MARKKTIKDALVEEKVKSKDKKEELEEVEEIEEVEDEDLDFDEDYDDEKEEVKEEKKEKKDKKEDKKKDKKDGYFAQVNRELKKVVWPSALDVAKYSLAVIIFCVLLCLFFIGIDLIASFIKGLF